MAFTIVYSSESITADLTLIDGSPSLDLKDSDCTDSDINASLSCNATATGTGAEDIDVTLKQQVAGSLTTFINSNADGALTLGQSGQEVTVAGKLSSYLGAAEQIRLATNANDYTKFTMDANGGISIETVDAAAAAANMALVADGSFAVTSTAFNLSGAGAASGLTTIANAGLITNTSGAVECLRLATNATDYTKFTLDANGGLAIESIDAGAAAANISITADGSLALASSQFNVTSAGAVSGVTTVNMTGAITGATATDTINSVIINAGAVSGVTTLGMGGALSGVTSIANTSQEITLAAAGKLLISATAADHTDTAGCIDLNLESATANVIGLDVNSTLTGDVDGVSGIKSTITGLAAGGGSGNMTHAFQAALVGDNNDTDHTYIALSATDFAANGGSSAAAALSIGTGYGFTIITSSGDLEFDDYKPSILSIYTGIAAATEGGSMDFGDGDTKVWAAGAGPLAAQRDWRFLAHTYQGDAGAALTITDAATVYIDAAPTASTNMTVTNPYALWVDSGAVRIDDRLDLSSMTVDVEAVTASVTTDGNSLYFGCDTVGADTVTLQTADTVAGRVIIVKDQGGNAAVMNITIATEAGELIDGQATQVIADGYGHMKLISDGTNWFVIESSS